MSFQVHRPLKINFLNGVYYGSVKNGKCQGNGIFCWDSGEFYFGEWEQNKMHGEGIFFFAYGGVLKGQFYKSRINGAAILKFPNGDVYEGFWRHGKLDGKCFKYFLADKTWALCIYENGIYRKCLNRGKGTPNMNFEEKLTDNIEVQPFDGPGKNVGSLPFLDGGKYYGIVEEDAANGLGFTFHPNGANDMGFYNEGVLEGLGRLFFQDGNFYDGELGGGQLQGEGFFYKKDSNRWIFGKFEEGKCQSVEKKGTGVPLEELYAWKLKRRSNEHIIKKYILNNVFFVPVLEEAGKKQKKTTQRFIGLRKDRNKSISDSQAIIDINEVLQYNPDAELLGLESPAEGQQYNKNIDNSYLEKDNLAEPRSALDELEAKGAQGEKILTMRIQDNIEKNWDFFSIAAAQQTTSEEPQKDSLSKQTFTDNSAISSKYVKPKMGRSFTTETGAPKPIQKYERGRSETQGNEKTSFQSMRIGTGSSKDSGPILKEPVGSSTKQPPTKLASKPKEKEKEIAREKLTKSKTLGQYDRNAPPVRTGSGSATSPLKPNEMLSPGKRGRTERMEKTSPVVSAKAAKKTSISPEGRGDRSEFDPSFLEETEKRAMTSPGQGEHNKDLQYKYWPKSDNALEDDMLFSTLKNMAGSKEDQSFKAGSLSSIHSNQVRVHGFDAAKDGSLRDFSRKNTANSRNEDEDGLDSGDAEDLYEREQKGKGLKIAKKPSKGSKDDGKKRHKVPVNFDFEGSDDEGEGQDRGDQDDQDEDHKEDVDDEYSERGSATEEKKKSGQRKLQNQDVIKRAEDFLKNKGKKVKSGGPKIELNSEEEASQEKEGEEELRSSALRGKEVIEELGEEEEASPKVMKAKQAKRYQGLGKIGEKSLSQETSPRVAQEIFLESRFRNSSGQRSGEKGLKVEENVSEEWPEEGEEEGKLRKERNVNLKLNVPGSKQASSPQKPQKDKSSSQRGQSQSGKAGSAAESEKSRKSPRGLSPRQEYDSTKLKKQQSPTSQKAPSGKLVSATESEKNRKDSRSRSPHQEVERQYDSAKSQKQQKETPLSQKEKDQSAKLVSAADSTKSRKSPRSRSPHQETDEQYNSAKLKKQPKESPTAQKSQGGKSLSPSADSEKSRKSSKSRSPRQEVDINKLSPILSGREAPKKSMSPSRSQLKIPSREPDKSPEFKNKDFLGIPEDPFGRARKKSYERSQKSDEDKSLDYVQDEEGGSKTVTFGRISSPVVDDSSPAKGRYKYEMLQEIPEVETETNRSQADKNSLEKLNTEGGLTVPSHRRINTNRSENQEEGAENLKQKNLEEPEEEKDFVRDDNTFRKKGELTFRNQDAASRGEQRAEPKDTYEAGVRTLQALEKKERGSDGSYRDEYAGSLVIDENEKENEITGPAEIEEDEDVDRLKKVDAEWDIEREEEVREAGKEQTRQKREKESPKKKAALPRAEEEEEEEKIISPGKKSQKGESQREPGSGLSSKSRGKVERSSTGRVEEFEENVEGSAKLKSPTKSNRSARRKESEEQLEEGEEDLEERGIEERQFSPGKKSQKGKEQEESGSRLSSKSRERIERSSTGKAERLDESVERSAKLKSPTKSNRSVSRRRESEEQLEEGQEDEEERGTEERQVSPGKKSQKGESHREPGSGLSSKSRERIERSSTGRVEKFEENVKGSAKLKSPTKSSRSVRRKESEEQLEEGEEDLEERGIEEKQVSPGKKSQKGKEQEESGSRLSSKSRERIERSSTGKAERLDESVERSAKLKSPTKSNRSVSRRKESEEQLEEGQEEQEEREVEERQVSPGKKSQKGESHGEPGSGVSAKEKRRLEGSPLKVEKLEMEGSAKNSPKKPSRQQSARETVEDVKEEEGKRRGGSSKKVTPRKHNTPRKEGEGGDSDEEFYSFDKGDKQQEDQEEEREDNVQEIREKASPVYKSKILQAIYSPTTTSPVRQQEVASPGKISLGSPGKRGETEQKSEADEQKKESPEEKELGSSQVSGKKQAAPGRVVFVSGSRDELSSRAQIETIENLETDREGAREPRSGSISEKKPSMSGKLVFVSGSKEELGSRGRLESFELDRETARRHEGHEDKDAAEENKERRSRSVSEKKPSASGKLVFVSGSKEELGSRGRLESSELDRTENKELRSSSVSERKQPLSGRLVFVSDSRGDTDSRPGHSRQKSKVTEEIPASRTTIESKEIGVQVDPDIFETRRPARIEVTHLEPIIIQDIREKGLQSAKKEQETQTKAGEDIKEEAAQTASSPLGRVTTHEQATSPLLFKDKSQRGSLEELEEDRRQEGQETQKRFHRQRTQASNDQLASGVPSSGALPQEVEVPGQSVEGNQTGETISPLKKSAVRQDVDKDDQHEAEVAQDENADVSHKQGAGTPLKKSLVPEDSNKAQEAADVPIIGSTKETEPQEGDGAKVPQPEGARKPLAVSVVISPDKALHDQHIKIEDEQGVTLRSSKAGSPKHTEDLGTQRHPTFGNSQTFAEESPIKSPGLEDPLTARIEPFDELKSELDRESKRDIQLNGASPPLNGSIDVEHAVMNPNDDSESDISGFDHQKILQLLEGHVKRQDQLIGQIHGIPSPERKRADSRNKRGGDAGEEEKGEDSQVDVDQADQREHGSETSLEPATIITSQNNEDLSVKRLIEDARSHLLAQDSSLEDSSLQISSRLGISPEKDALAEQRDEVGILEPDSATQKIVDIDTAFKIQPSPGVSAALSAQNKEEGNVRDAIVDKISRSISQEIDQIFTDSVVSTKKKLASIDTQKDSAGLNQVPLSVSIHSSNPVQAMEIVDKLLRQSSLHSDSATSPFAKKSEVFSQVITTPLHKESNTPVHYPRDTFASPHMRLSTHVTGEESGHFVSFRDQLQTQGQGQGQGYLDSGRKPEAPHIEGMGDTQLVTEIGGTSDTFKAIINPQAYGLASMSPSSKSSGLKESVTFVKEQANPLGANELRASYGSGSLVNMGTRSSHSPLLVKDKTQEENLKASNYGTPSLKGSDLYQPTFTPTSNLKPEVETAYKNVTSAVDEVFNQAISRLNDKADGLSPYSVTKSSNISGTPTESLRLSQQRTQEELYSLQPPTTTPFITTTPYGKSAAATGNVTGQQTPGSYLAAPAVISGSQIQWEHKTPEHHKLETAYTIANTEAGASPAVYPGTYSNIYPSSSAISTGLQGIQTTTNAYPNQLGLLSVPVMVGQSPSNPMSNFEHDILKGSPDRARYPLTQAERETKQGYLMKTPTREDKDDSGLIYQTPDNKANKKIDEQDSAKDESYFTPVDTSRKRYMYPNTPLAKIEEGDEGSYALGTASKMPREVSYIHSYTSSVKNSPSHYQNPLPIYSPSKTAFVIERRNDGRKLSNAPSMMKPDIRSEDDVMETRSLGASRMMKTTPKKFDVEFLWGSPNRKFYQK